jgi:hypothetical protein
MGMVSPADVEVQGFPPDPTTASLTLLATDALKVHLRFTLRRMLALGFDGPEAVAAWRNYWGEVLDSIVAEAEL